MKQNIWIIITVIVATLLILYFINKNKQTATPIVKNQTTPAGYELGLQLANLINNTQCGKNGNPPCTISDLQAAGWSPEQIASAEAGTQSLSTAYLCTQFGINC